MESCVRLRKQRKNEANMLDLWGGYDLIWNYRVVQHHGHVQEADWVGLHEIYYDENKKIKDWHGKPAAAANDLDDMIAELRKQLFAAESAKSLRKDCRVLDEAEMPVDDEGDSHETRKNP